jgi:hypothetical protein
MQSKELNKEDFLSLEELFNEVQTEITVKFFKGKPFEQELVNGFRKLYLFLEKVLTRAGIKPIIPSAAGNQLCADHQNSESLSTKILNILET